MQPPSFKVIDLFAGPGGLAEGFSSVLGEDGARRFEIALSAEKDAAAHQTLMLRSFTRQFPPDELPEDYYAFCEQRLTLQELADNHREKWAHAEREAMLVELGTRAGDRKIDDRINALLKGQGRDPGRRFVIIGGPPCQAYSLVGRARNAGIRDYRADKDHRHFLYRDYIRILARVGPAAFVMENVKGMLSSSIGGTSIFAQVLEDLRHPDSGRHRYRLLALSPPRDLDIDVLLNPRPQDFIVRAENHGVPQARHRVIVVGIREDLFSTVDMEVLMSGAMPAPSATRTVRDVIGKLPRLRSGLSRKDSPDAWQAGFRKAADKTLKAVSMRGASQLDRQLASRLRGLLDAADDQVRLARSSTRYKLQNTRDELIVFLQDPRLEILPNHESRGHMEGDLARYLFCSLFAEQTGRSPKAADFPKALAPDHANWESGKFADRFRVQLANAPSTTVTSHISKDGHYFIHPDPDQCRSLTVREAARLQTFPDNYIFLGNRTEQYIQVGNAVPPFLARQIAQAILRLMGSMGERLHVHANVAALAG